jgi:hypothetical protein
MANALDDYIAALERLKARKPLRVPQGTRITNDAIALEAGRGKGSIKKSRPAFAELIKNIDTAATEQATPAMQERMRLERIKDSAAGYRRQLEASLAREISLLRELYHVRQQLAQLTGANVVPLRGKAELPLIMDKPQ